MQVETETRNIGHQSKINAPNTHARALMRKSCVLTVPLGAMPTNSSTLTSLCVHQRPSLVCRKLLSDHDPSSGAYHVTCT